MKNEDMWVGLLMLNGSLNNGKNEDETQPA